MDCGSTDPNAGAERGGAQMGGDFEPVPEVWGKQWLLGPGEWVAFARLSRCAVQERKICQQLRGECESQRPSSAAFTEALSPAGKAGLEPARVSSTRVLMGNRGSHTLLFLILQNRWVAQHC